MLGLFCAEIHANYKIYLHISNICCKFAADLYDKNTQIIKFVVYKR